jgi:hypothetical protein
MNGYDRLNSSQLIQSTLLIVFNLCIISSPSLAFLHFKFPPLFGFTSTRDVFSDLSTLRHTLGFLLLDEVPSERQDRSATKKTTLCAIADRPSFSRGPSERTQRSRSCVHITDHRHLREEHRQLICFLHVQPKLTTGICHIILLFSQMKILLKIIIIHYGTTNTAFVEAR